MDLQSYRVEKKEGRTGISIKQLEDPEVIAEVVGRYARVSDIELESTAASLVMKRYAVMTAAAALEYYGLKRGKVNWLKEAEFHFDHFVLLESDDHEEMNRDWKTVVFAEHLTPMVQRFSKTCKIPQKILWENIAVRMQAVFRKKAGDYSQDQLEELFCEMTAPDAPWTGLEVNPFTTYLQRPDSWDVVPVRETCCRLYQIKQGEEQPYCGNCPLR
ncbi:IucA/IucC family C-terminal-domain containing protein [Jeotgalibacillus sp. R-1-5s-1]|uniref:IucA/IucC family C-terminal-domain containing protein n=1 Tax=Jeotgalibacillus sp. R-1-5s-1 TaxID=2555897 RepID=UPI00106CFBA2|nr:IucA/IucC family C-terminal-domain containing protein [Jeotgalibacillus sp. R-1-5s-1]TFE00210.1 hypothetical protein E2491_06635 [Jeotgalibacillus sp. R-1-5s-1]